MIVRVLVSTNQLIPLAELGCNVASIIEPISFTSNPAMLESFGSGWSIQFGRRCPGTATRGLLARL
jgi:hypothetical protein